MGWWIDVMGSGIVEFAQEFGVRALGDQGGSTLGIDDCRDHANSGGGVV